MNEPFVYEMTPRFADTDAYGVMHHSHFYQWMEEARFDFVQTVLHLSIEEFQNGGIRVLVSETSSRHKLPVRYGDRLRIEMFIKVDRAARWQFIYRIVNARTNQLHAEATTSHVYVSGDGTLLLNHPEWLWERIQQVIQKNPGRYVMM